MSREDLEQLAAMVAAQLRGKQAPGEEQLVSITEAGARAGSSDRKIRKLLSQRKITRYGRGHGTRVKMSEVFEALRLEGMEPAKKSGDARADEILRGL